MKTIDWEELCRELELTSYTPRAARCVRITGAYCGDLLSDVLARARPGSLWITIQKHRNVIAVASLTGMSGVIITGGREPDRDTRESAKKEFIPLFSTPLDNFTAAGRLYAMLARAEQFDRRS